MKFNLLTKYAHFIFPFLGLAYILLLTLHYPSGVSMDSVSYIELAKNLSAGKGLINSEGEFVNHWPPLYPMALSAVSSFFGIDVLTAAKYFSAILFCAFLFITNLVLARFRINPLTVLLLNAFVFLSPAMQIFLMLWSEGLFMTILMLLLYVILVWTENRRLYLLIIAGILSGILILTRYAGIGFVGGVILFLLFERQKALKEKLANAFLISLPALLFFAGWLYYSSLFENHTTTRSLLFHLPTPGHIVVFIRNLSAWFFPLYTWFGLGILFILVIWSILKDKVAIKQFIQNKPDEKFQLLLYMSISYILFLFFSIIFIHYSTPLDNRILAPLLPFLAILLVPIITHLLNLPAARRLYQALLILIFINLAVAFANRSFDFYNNGKGYTSKTWMQSPTLNYIINNNAIRNIHSNGTDVLRYYQLSIRTLSDIPFWIDSDTKIPNAAYQTQLDALKQSIASGNAVLVYFDNITWRYYFPNKEKLLEEFSSFQIIRFEDGVVIER